MSRRTFWWTAATSLVVCVGFIFGRELPALAVCWVGCKDVAAFKWGTSPFECGTWSEMSCGYQTNPSLYPVAYDNWYYGDGQEDEGGECRSTGSTTTFSTCWTCVDYCSGGTWPHEAYNPNFCEPHDSETEYNCWFD